MNSMSRKIRQCIERIAEEQRKAEEEKYLVSLSEEERKAYLKDQEERARRAIRSLAEMIAMSAGAYSAMNYKKGQ